MTNSYKIKEIGGITIRETTTAVDNNLCDQPSLAFEFFKNTIEKSIRFTPSVENFIVLILNTRRRITDFQIIATGTLDTLLVHPREVFRGAILRNASVIILMHNHPSGETSPSEADIKMTRDLIKAGRLLKIEVLDHVIVGDSFNSLKDEGYFYA